ncbi:MAG: 2,4-dihydroxyhept-2-ene-1,7-dioic acid aldolase [Hyphomicrobiaceae bacterium]|nr:MAG: 2,4-dihydroxyhept-2-ene-1,7-dioic acid aldolase [Hyphomicrobiaceae bacterium]KAB2851825.1 MAG: 2,4-dihydroxyhept-2-ene-1,7-dioic acid aldolase [Hyphomicrobiaceae bacterium]
MRKNALKKKIADGVRAVNGWVAIPNPYATEIYAAQGWDSVALDMQHGALDINDVVPLLQAIGASDATPMARVPWNDPASIMRVLDAGAYGIICPMINTKAEAEAFVRAGRYPPLGARSFGPFRAAQYGGADYWQHANEEVLLLAMIETREAVSNLHEILSVKGLDGVYIGPSDLSFSMGKTPTLDPTDKEVLAAMAIILKETRERGLIAGAHTDGPKTAQKRFDEGFQLCTILNDVRLLAMAAQAAVREARGQGAAEKAKTY